MIPVDINGGSSQSPAKVPLVGTHRVRRYWLHHGVQGGPINRKHDNLTIMMIIKTEIMRIIMIVIIIIIIMIIIIIITLVIMMMMVMMMMITIIVFMIAI